MQLDGRFTISRVTSNNSPDYISVEFTDENSGIQFVSTKIRLDDFTRAITGLSHVNCKMKVCGLDKVGKNAFYKTESISFKVPEFAEREEVDEIAKLAVSKYEVDGWSCFNLDRIHNFHYTKGQPVGNGMRKITVKLCFVRYVKK